MAAFALDWTIESLRTQSTSNGSGKLSQTVRFSLVEMSTEIKLGRTFLEKLIADHMEGRDIVSETSMAKFWNTEMANRVVGGCLDLCGEMAMLESCPIVRTFRDVRVTSIFAGTNEIMKSIVAKNMKL